MKKRFTEAGINNYQSFITDLSKHVRLKNSFNLIVCDVPCTGSGTWSRTPEQLFFYNETEIEKYTLVQKKIISNTLPYLDENGYFLYITCAIFKEENEAAVAFIQSQF